MNEYVPQVVTDGRPVGFWFVSAATMLFVVGLIVTAPLAAANGHNEWAQVIYHAFGVFCHQLPERSFFIEGHKLAVCSRCTGLYGGFAIILLLYPLIRSLRNPAMPPRVYLLLAAIPLGIDFSLTFFGVWENTHTSRLLTGALLGSVAVFYVMPGIIDLSLRGFRSERPSNHAPTPTFTLASPERIAAAPSDYSAPDRRI
jgi:uncharacterized membrane protein